MRINCIVLIVVILIAMSCSLHINSSYKPIDSDFFDLEGHRGCRGLMPENTIAGFLKAIERAVTTLEMDAVITKDNQVILSHEPFFNHEITTLPDGSFITEAEEKSFNIYQMTYQQVGIYDVGMKPHPRFMEQQKAKAVKPLLSAVIDSVEVYAKLKGRKPLFYNIETKCLPDGDDLYHPKPALFVELLMKVILEKGISDRVIIQSFDPRSLQYVHEKYPAIKTALLVEGEDPKNFALQLQQLGFIPSIYSPNYQLVTPLLIKQCHDTGIKIIPWTIEDIDTMKQLKKMGVDGLISDYPNFYKDLK